MQYALMLYFDKDTDNIINSYIKRLKDCSNNIYMINKKIPPHITLAMWNSDKSFEDEIKKFAENRKSFNLIFGSIGIFKGGINHLFLSPVKNKMLSDIHDDIYDILKLEQYDEFDMLYKDNNLWVPHTTIGYEILPQNISRAVELIDDIILPQKAKIQKIALAICCPFTQLHCFDLRHCPNIQSTENK